MENRAASWKVQGGEEGRRAARGTAYIYFKYFLKYFMYLWNLRDPSPWPALSAPVGNHDLGLNFRY